VTGKTYKNGKRWKVATTEQLLGMMERKKNNTTKNHLYIPLPEPVQYQGGERDRSITPYTMGLILGNGNITGKSVSISHGDEAIKDYLIHEHECGSIKYDYGAWTVSMMGLQPYLKKYGLMGKYSYEKFIPDEYKFLDAEGRWELLRGLMDTDGTCDKGGHPSYSTTSEQLAKDVQWLVRSLGGKCTISEYADPVYYHHGEKRHGRKAYNLYIRFKDVSIPIFKLKRKQERMTEWNGGLGEMHLQITSIEKAEDDYGYCIQVDDPASLFLVEDFIVTHNSHAVCDHLCEKMLSETGKGFVIARKSMTDLRKTVYMRGNPSIIRTLKNWKYDDFYLNRSENYMRINGNDVFFTGVEDPDSLRSMNVNYAWFEEVTDFDWEDFLEIENRTRAPNTDGLSNHIYMSSNPSKSWHWSVQHFYLNPLEKYQQNCIYHISSPLHNPFLPKSAIEDLKRQAYYDANLYRVNILGEPGLPEGLVYTHIEQLPEEMWDEQIWHIPPVYGLDFGVNHPMAVSECRKYKNVWYVRQRFFARDQLNYDLLKFFQKSNEKWKEHVKPKRSLCDTEQEYIDAMDLWEACKFIPNLQDYKEYGYDSSRDLIPFNFDTTSRYWCDHQPDFYRPLMNAGHGYVRKANKSNVLAGIMTVKKYRIIISSQSSEGLQQFGQYSWIKKRGDVTQRDEPEKIEDDFPDCVRYAIHSEETYKATGGGFLGSTSTQPNSQLKTPPKTTRSKAVYIPTAQNRNDPYDGW